MLPATAIEFVSHIVYKPGWIFTAEDYTKRFETAICVRVTYPAPESSRHNAPEYAEMIEARAAFPIQLADCPDAAALYRKVIEQVLVIEEHEARELFRIAPSHWAPFHPHTVNGMNRWGNPQTDLMFGLV